MDLIGKIEYAVEKNEAGVGLTDLSKELEINKSTLSSYVTVYKLFQEEKNTLNDKIKQLEKMLSNDEVKNIYKTVKDNYGHIEDKIRQYEELKNEVGDILELQKEVERLNYKNKELDDFNSKVKLRQKLILLEFYVIGFMSGSIASYFGLKYIQSL